jgi:hypothetical protein
MSEKPQDLKSRTKAFALRVIRIYSKLPKNDAVAQVLGKQVLSKNTAVQDRGSWTAVTKEQLACRYERRN